MGIMWLPLWVDLVDAQHIAQHRLKQPTFARGLECIEVQVCV